MSSSTPSQSLDVSFLTLSMVVFAVLPLIFLIFLYVTDWDVRLGRAVGVNLPVDSNLVIYNAACQAGKDPLITLVYWSRQSAPLALEIETFTSPTITSQAGINTLEITLTRIEQCPERIILTDLSRNRHTGIVVEEVR